jgi:2-haloacid dehalogenase
VASKIRGIVWDVGNVLVAWDPAWLYNQLIRDPAKAAWWARESFSMDWNLLGDRGMTYAEANPLWIARFEREYGDRIDDFPCYRALIEAYGRHPEEAHAWLNLDTIALRDALRAKYPALALTNFSSENWPRVDAAHGGKIDKFDAVVMSSRAGAVKPEAEIFARLFATAREQYGLAPEELVFIDDSAKNVAGAKACGLRALLFTEAARLRRDLAALGIEIPEAGAGAGMQMGAGLGRLAPLL